ncbi:MAG: ERCC4 domain-containing protein [Caldisericum exile]|uniref:ERCC4 domain-containing protein n=1 Tax=Caldisericum exile TaxID=693075 RepID=UPI003C74115C
MPIYVDDREQFELIQLLKHRKLAVEVRRLECGDIVFGDVCIERKTLTDLINSVFDKRLWNQLDIMHKTFKIPLLLIENWTGITKQDKLTTGVLSTLILNWKQPIIFSYDIYETSKWIEVLFLKYGISKSNREPPAAVKKQHNIEDIKLEMLQVFPRVGPMTAKRILKEIPYIFTKPIEKQHLNIRGLSDYTKELIWKVLGHE